MKTVRRKQNKKVNGKVVLGAAGGVVVLALLAGGGGSKKDAPAPTAAPAAIVTEYVTVAPVTQIPVTVAPATVPPATPVPATQAPTAGPTEIPTLKKGSKGEAVKALQQRLIDLKYLSGKADGDFGSMTAKAVKDFQLVNHFETNGIATPNIIESMFSRWCRPNMTVYRTSSGSVYHFDPSCSNMKNPISLTLVEAMTRHLDQCQKCSP